MAHRWKDVRKPLWLEAEARVRQDLAGVATVMALHRLQEAPSLSSADGSLEHEEV